MRLILLFIFAIATTLGVSAQQTTYQLSTHILDITQGQPAANVAVVLEKQDLVGDWYQVSNSQTDQNGRISNFLLQNSTMDNQGIYRLIFKTKAYFEAQGMQTFYPYIEVVFEINDSKHYHVPITLSPYGYSTYRGS